MINSPPFETFCHESWDTLKMPFQRVQIFRWNMCTLGYKSTEASRMYGCSEVAREVTCWILPPYPRRPADTGRITPLHFAETWSFSLIVRVARRRPSLPRSAPRFVVTVVGWSAAARPGPAMAACAGAVLNADSRRVEGAPSAPQWSQRHFMTDVLGAVKIRNYRGILLSRRGVAWLRTRLMHGAVWRAVWSPRCTAD